MRHLYRYIMACFFPALLFCCQTTAAPFHKAALDKVDSDEAESPVEKRVIKNVSNHPYSTVTSRQYPLALVSGEGGATLIDYQQAKIITTLNTSGTGANSGLFVRNGDDEIIYVMAFNQFAGASNHLYAFPLKNGAVSGRRLTITGYPGMFFPANSFSLAADQQGQYLYFVTLTTDHCDGIGACTGRRWLNQVTVSSETSQLKSIEMPVWHGYSGDGGDYGVSLTADGKTAYLTHNKQAYQVTGLTDDNPVIHALPIDYGDASLINSSGNQLLVFSYGDIYLYRSPQWQEKVLFHQSGQSQSFLQSAQLYDSDQKLLFTLQDVAVQSLLQHKSPLQIVKRHSASFFPANEVASINLVDAKVTKLYKREFSGPYPTSARWSQDGKYLLITLWNEPEDTTELAVYTVP